MALPNFQQLYDEAQDAVTSDPALVYDDFTPGSWLDSFAAVAAMSGLSIVRWINREARRFFRSTASGTDLDDAVADIIGTALTREPGESDDAFNARVDDYLARGLGRATPDALDYLLNSGIVTGLASGTVEEDFSTGQTTLSITLEDGAVEADVRAALAAVLPAWRKLNGYVVVEVV